MAVSPRAIIVLCVALVLLFSTCGGPQLLAPEAPAAVGQRLAGVVIAPPRALATPPPAAVHTLNDEAASRAALAGMAAPVQAGAAVVDVGQLGTALDSYLAELTNGGMFGGAVLVARNGQVLLRKGYGSANTATGTSNTPQTRFRLASLSKQFTAAAIMILQARGALKLNDSICSYLDPCPEAWRPIGIRHLLTHSSGLPNYTDFADFDASEMLPTTPADLVARFRDLPLNFEPGTLYSYNNSGYLLLGMIIERASGQPYEEFMRQTIFGPLGMRDSGVDHNAGTISAGALGYRAVGQPADFLDTSTLFACGSLYSTVEDLYRWDQALYGDLPLTQTQRDEIFTPGLGTYGYGWLITSPGGRRLISHQGNISGFSNFIARYPDDRLTIIVLSNLETADAAGIAAYLANITLGS